MRRRHTVLVDGVLYVPAKHREELRLYSVQEAAEALGVTYRTVYRMTKDGRLKGTRVGGTMVIEETEVMRYLARAGRAT